MVDLDAYFARIGYDGPAVPTLATLRALSWLHPAAIPFETFDVRLGLGVSLEPGAVDAKLIAGGRGGYCFEHNTLMRRVLAAIGFEVEALIARSRWGRTPEDLQARTHMALRVRLDGALWLVDVGFGTCMQTAPLRFDREGPQATTFEPMRLTPVAGEVRLEALVGDDWRAVCDLVPTAQEDADIEAANWFISTHPDSRLKRTLVVTRTTPGLRLVLVDNELTVRRRGPEVERRRLDATEAERVLAGAFGLAVQPGWRALFEDLEAAAGPSGVPAANRR